MGYNIIKLPLEIGLMVCFSFAWSWSEMGMENLQFDSEWKFKKGGKTLKHKKEAKTEKSLW